MRYAPGGTCVIFAYVRADELEPKSDFRTSLLALQIARELMTIDENLVRSELTASQRADHTARRKAIYETLYPETQHGAIGNGRAKSPQVEDSTAPSFTESTAEATGRSRQSVERDARRGSRIDPTVMADLQGTLIAFLPLRS